MGTWIVNYTLIKLQEVDPLKTFFECSDPWCVFILCGFFLLTVIVPAFTAGEAIFTMKSLDGWSLWLYVWAPIDFKRNILPLYGLKSDCSSKWPNGKVFASFLGDAECSGEFVRKWIPSSATSAVGRITIDPYADPVFTCSWVSREMKLVSKIGAVGEWIKMN